MKTNADLQTIKGVEIFAEGTWNGDPYTEKDLMAIEASFQQTKNLLKPYLKIGHGDAQKLLAEDELPAAGFVSNVYRKGKKLLADFTHVPAKIYELIKNGAYNRVSSELFVNFKTGDQTHPFALKAVAILGGATPAVHTLADILNLYSDSIGARATYAVVTDSIKAFEMDMISEVNLNQGENQMTIEELNRQVVKLESDNKSLQTENAELEKDLTEAQTALKTSQEEVKKITEKVAAVEKEFSQHKKQVTDTEIENEVKQFVSDEKILPAQAPFLIALLKNVQMNQETKKFTVAEKEYQSVRELVKAFVTAHVEINTGDKGGADRGTVGQEAIDTLNAKALKYASENKVSFKDALIAVSPQNPETDSDQ
jgi:DNA gyrase/topoisomerase IV subunit A